MPAAATKGGSHSCGSSQAAQPPAAAVAATSGGSAASASGHRQRRKAAATPASTSAYVSGNAALSTSVRFPAVATAKYRASAPQQDATNAQPRARAAPSSRASARYPSPA